MCRFKSPVLLIFFVGLGLRLIMPAYILNTDTNAIDLMLQQGHADFSVQYAKSLTDDSIKIPRAEVLRQLHGGGVHMGILLALSSNLLDMVSLNIPPIIVVQVFGAIMDSIGCLLLFKLLSIKYGKRAGLIGALIYALWLPSIFFSYHLLIDAYIPLLTLAIACSSVLAADRNNIYLWGLAGFFCGLIISVKFDNALALPFLALFVLFFRHHNKTFINSVGTCIVLICCAYASYSVATKSIAYIALSDTNYPFKNSHSSYLGPALYNSLGEYPGTFKGLRFFKDNLSTIHSHEMAEQYQKTNDTKYAIIMPLVGGDPLLAAFVREVIVGKPFLYFDWVVRRTVVYFPAVPYYGAIAHYFVFNKGKGWKTMLNYRYEQVFHGVKYLDYILFALFLFGLIISYRGKDWAMLCILPIYIGYLMGHVFTLCGETYFRADKEEAFIELRYLLGMVSLWPVFIAISLDWMWKRGSSCNHGYPL